MKSLIARRIFIWTSTFIVALTALWGTIVSAAPTVRYYTAAISPTSIGPGLTGAAFSVTITNDATTTSTQSMGSATVTVPAGFSNVNILNTTGSSKTWNYNLSGNVIQLVASNGTQKLNPNEFVKVNFTTNTPCDSGDYTFTSYGYQSTDYVTTPYVLIGNQPVVNVPSSCSTFTSWTSGDYCTYGHGAWGQVAHGNIEDGGNTGLTRDTYFDSVYPTGATVGVGYTMTFDSSINVENYLPACSTPSALTTSLVNPVSDCPNPGSAGGVFGGHTLALKLNKDFNATGYLDSNLTNFGSIVLFGTGKSLDGKSITYILNAAETALGGGSLPSGYSISELNSLIDSINSAFSECEPSDWAQAHLKPGT